MTEALEQLRESGERDTSRNCRRPWGTWRRGCWSKRTQRLRPRSAYGSSDGCCNRPIEGSGCLHGHRMQPLPHPSGRAPGNNNSSSTYGRPSSAVSAIRASRLSVNLAPLPPFSSLAVLAALQQGSLILRSQKTQRHRQLLLRESDTRGVACTRQDRPGRPTSSTQYS